MTASWMTSAVLATSLLLGNPQAAQEPGQDYVAEAKAVVLELASRQFEKVFARFDERMAQAVPVDKLAATWDQMVTQLGAFQEITETRREEVAGQQVVYVTCQFEKTVLDAKVMFDAKGRVATFLFTPSQTRPQWTAPEYARPEAFQERQVNIGQGQWQLPGTLALPNGKGPFPAVVLVHGSGPHDQDETLGPNKPFKDLAWGLASRNIAVLRYVKRTMRYGKELLALPTGITVNEETIEDARAGVALLAALPEVNANQIYVLGHSLGAMLAPRIATSDPQIAGIILMAGSTRPLEELLVEQIRYIAGADGKITEEEQKRIDAAEQTAREIRRPDLTPTSTVNFLGAPTPGTYWLDLRNYRPAEAAAALEIPILVLQGERDYQVRPADFEGWKKALAGRTNVTLKLYPALNHLFVSGTGPSLPVEYLTPGHVAVEVIQDIATWIAAWEKKKS